MKLVALMCLECYKDKVHKLFQRSEVQIYSEVDITGHTSATLDRHGVWFSDSADDIPQYSKLYFAIVPKEKAAGMMKNIDQLRDSCDPEHPPRAFQVDVEKMI